ncbi:hypothetical protein JOC36_001672 [Weissella uvarum]|nr:hypothetical protein [Weissella uvarum]
MSYNEIKSRSLKTEYRFDINKCVGSPT